MSKRAIISKPTRVKGNAAAAHLDEAKARYKFGTTEGRENGPLVSDTW